MFIGDYIKFVVYISSAISQLSILCGNGDMLIQHVSDQNIFSHLVNLLQQNVLWSLDPTKSTFLLISVHLNCFFFYNPE